MSSVKRKRSEYDDVVLCCNVHLRGKHKIKNRVCTFDQNWSWLDVFDDLLSNDVDKSIRYDSIVVSVATQLNGSEVFHPDKEECVANVLKFDSNLKYVNFNVVGCEPEQIKTTEQKNAFTTMMASVSGRESEKAPKQKSAQAARFTAKDSLYNEVCNHMSSCGVGFPRSMPDETVRKHMDIVTNALWYLDGNKDKLTDRAKHADNVKPLPVRFLQDFNNFNDWKKKKQKTPRLHTTDLKRHSAAIFRLVSMIFTHRWSELRRDLEQLALVLDSYAEYLDEENEQQMKRQKSDHPTHQHTEH